MWHHGDSMKPFWTTPKMVGESILFIQTEGDEPVSGHLLFTPTKVLAVTNSAGTTTYEADKDYRCTPGSRQITIPKGSAIPVTPPTTLTPPKGTQPFNLVRGDGTGDILFGASHEYADMQVTVTYEHAGNEWQVPPPTFAEKELPLTLAKLRAGEPLTIVLFGDSISAGCQASKLYNVPPFMPPFGDLMAQCLERTYTSPITYKNESVGGMGAAWGLENIGKVAAATPDLVILAWGMNDNPSTPVEAFIPLLERQMEEVRKANPKAEFILVSTMLPNAEWYLIRPDRLLEYRDVMKTMVSPGIALADLTSVWEGLLLHKNYLDLTGNGVNHPNDFGHRLYAQVLAALLIKD